MVNVLGWGRNGNMYVVDIVIYSTKGMIIGGKLRQRIGVVSFNFTELNRKNLVEAYQSNGFCVFTLKKGKKLSFFSRLYILLSPLLT